MSNAISGFVGSKIHSATRSAVEGMLKLTAKLPGDPVTGAIARNFPDAKIERTGDESWTVTQKDGQVFKVSVSADGVKVNDGKQTITEPLPWPKLPSIHLPKLHGPDLGEIANAIGDHALSAMFKLAVNGPIDVVGLAARNTFPGATVKKDGAGTWTVTPKDLEPPFQITVKGTTLTATRDGVVLATRTVTTADAKAELRHLFASL